MSNYYKNDDAYQDWEYPDQEDIDALDHIDVGNSDSRKVDKMSLPIKLFGGFMVVAFVGSLLVPVIGSFSGSSVDDSIQSEEEFVKSVYSEVIEQKVTEVLRDNPEGDTIGYLSVEFPQSEQDPLIAILVNYSTNSVLSNIDRANVYSVDLFREIFTDIRFRNITLVWFEASGVGTDGEMLAKPFLMVGVSRTSSIDINWSSITSEDLRYIADYYQEYPEQ